MSSVLEHYNFLHKIPEIGFKEFKTSEYLSSKIQLAGYDVERNINGTTGIVADLDSGKPGPTLALRADMDALRHIIDGTECLRHTCGHDAHSSVVLAVAEEIIRENTVQKGKLRIIFQPAEELGTGAIEMVNGGALAGVDMLMGFHLRPIEECVMGQAIPAMYYSASSTLKVEFIGKPAHAARPHLGVNALEIAALSVSAAKGVQLPPQATWSAKATRFISDAGVTNSIPENATVYWDLRADQNSLMDELISKITLAIESCGAAYGAKVITEIVKQIPAAIIHDDVTAIINQSISEVLGEKNTLPPKSTAGGEDFFFYPLLCPNVKSGFWGLGTNLSPGLHHPEMKFDLESLENGVSIFKRAVSKVLG